MLRWCCRASCSRTNTESTLWVQDKVSTGTFAVRKLAGEVNPADLFTKHVPSQENIHQLTALFGCEYRES